ncbi:MAG: acyl-CoA dehydrogenase family protein, partial [Acidimicrobiia bacterium]|nr:acyl-CoA dehydrogenase family protein [Acidimicrobiia bacterium]
QSRTESSMAKLYCSEALSRVVDRSLQILGGTGITDRTVVRKTYEDIRAFRIYDGPSEVHRWSLARQVVKG